MKKICLQDYLPVDMKGYHQRHVRVAITLNEKKKKKHLAIDLQPTFKVDNNNWNRVKKSIK